jgi:hypothetical protein
MKSVAASSALMISRTRASARLRNHEGTKRSLMSSTRNALRASHERGT